MADQRKSGGKTLYCSFCGKSQHNVKKLISGPNVFICDECIALCVDIIHEEIEASEKEKRSAKGGIPTPETIKAIIAEYVIDQDQALEVVANGLYMHMQRVAHPPKAGEVDMPRETMIFIGASGCGKTLVGERLATAINVPYAHIDSTTLTEAGYVGKDVEEVVIRLLERCDYDVAKAGNGIVYLDEVDKKRKPTEFAMTRDVSGEGVQQALLKMLEGTAVVQVPANGNPKRPGAEMISVDTRNIKFILGGAFEGLCKIIRDRTTTAGSIGFRAERLTGEKDLRSDTEVLALVEPEDLIKFGMIRELVGRITTIVPFRELTVESLVKILTVPKDAIVLRYQRLFRKYPQPIELTFELDALCAIAEHALMRKVGARGLPSIVNKVLSESMYYLPQTTNVTRAVVTAESVDGRKGYRVLWFDKDGNQVTLETRKTQADKPPALPAPTKT